MATVKITYKLSEAGRRASLLAGGDGRQVQTIAVPATPELLALADVSQDGVASIYAVSYVYDMWSDASIVERRESLELDAPADDPAALVLALAVQRQADKASAEASAKAKKIELEAARAVRIPEQRALVAEWMADQSLGNPNRPDCVIGADGAHHSIADLPASEREAVSAERKRRHDLQLEADRKADEARKAAALAAREERIEWIREHGSERLKKCLALGMLEQCAGVYRDERLAHDHPGWILDCAETKEESEVRNPSLEALTILEEIHKTLPDATLVKVRPEPDGYEERAAPWREAVRIDDLPGIETNKILYRLI